MIRFIIQNLETNRKDTKDEMEEKIKLKSTYETLFQTLRLRVFAVAFILKNRIIYF